MSGPVHDNENVEAGPYLRIEVREGRAASLRGLDIMRVLPTKGRRTIGPWCFVDLMSPEDLAHPPRMEIGPHPHIGLATVTWLFEGAALHGDSLGTEQLIRPGELNLMTAGGGIAHSELGIVDEKLGSRAGDVSGVQMWIAQPEATRHGAAAFEHIGELPRCDLGGGEATVLAGSLLGATSPARIDTPLVGLDVSFGPSVAVPAAPGFEYAVVPLDRNIKVADAIVDPGSLAIVPPGADELPLEVESGRGRAMVLGGEPLGEKIQMWWNFVARSKEEITEAWRDWRSHNTDRFGPVPSELERMEAPPPPWVRPD